MKQKISLTTQGWHFADYPGLIWHSGRWWLHEKPIKPIYNNGGLSILYDGRKVSIRKLRKAAQPCTIQIGPLPF